MYTRQYTPKSSNGFRKHQRGGYKSGGSSLTPVTREQLIASLPPASAEQFAIIENVKHGEGDLICNACAGTGKTTTIKQMVAALTSDNVVYVVFSKALEQEVKPQIFGLAEVKTSYALGFEAVRSVLGEQIRRAGFKAVDERKYKKLAKQYALMLASQIRMAAFRQGPLTDEEINAKVPGERELREVLDALVTHCQSNLVDPSDYAAVDALVDHHNVTLPCELEQLLPVVNAILQQGIEMAKEQGIIGFADMVWLPHVLKIEAPRKFLYILVDEAQDINPAQREMIFKLRAQGGRIIWVGDRHQAIFGFASADAYSFENIKRMTNARDLPLTTCYRAPRAAIALAQEIVPQIQAAPDAPEGLVEYIGENDMFGLVREGDMVLCRMTAPLVKTCLQMIARKIPARVKGKNVGDQIIAFVEQVAEQPGFKYAQFLKWLDLYTEKLVKRLEGDDASEGVIEMLRDRSEAVKVCYQNFTACESVEELNAAIDDLFTEDRPGVTLSTVHRAKGLESERVFILRPDKLPLVWKGQQAWQYEQELNLKYVAVTRVKFNRKTGFAGELRFVG